MVGNDPSFNNFATDRSLRHVELQSQKFSFPHPNLLDLISPMSEYVDTEVIDMESDTQNGSQKAVPVYLSFKTLQSAIQSLRTHGLPNVFDRTAFDSRSGGEQTQILSAFKFLGFIDDTNRTQPVLRKLVDAAEGSVEEKDQIA